MGATPKKSRHFCRPGMNNRFIHSLALLVLIVTAASLAAVWYDPTTLNPPQYDQHQGPLFAYEDHMGEYVGTLHPYGARTVNVYLTSGNFNSAEREGARKRFDIMFPREKYDEITIVKVKYTWNQLRAWKKQLARAKDTHGLRFHGWKLSIPDIAILLEVEFFAEVALIEKFLEETGIPRDAVTIRIEPPTRLMSLLPTED